MLSASVVSRTERFGSLFTVLFIAACATGGGIAPRDSATDRAFCLEKLRGVWEGSISHTSTTAWYGGLDRTLIFQIVDGIPKALYGITGRGLDPVKVSVYFPDKGCNMQISFLTPTNSTVTLNLAGDQWLTGSFVLLNWAPKNITFLKK